MSSRPYQLLVGSAAMTANRSSSCLVIRYGIPLFYIVGDASPGRTGVPTQVDLAYAMHESLGATSADGGAPATAGGSGGALATAAQTSRSSEAYPTRYPFETTAFTLDRAT
jgi:hypothetical protein